MHLTFVLTLHSHHTAHASVELHVFCLTELALGKILACLVTLVIGTFISRCGKLIHFSLHCWFDNISFFTESITVLMELIWKTATTFDTKNTDYICTAFFIFS